MYIIFLLLPILIVLFSVLYLIVRKVAMVWLNYRLRMVVLERLERKPDLLNQFSEIEGLMDDSTDNSRQFDFLVTGISLASIGLICAIIAQIMGSSRWVVGAYVGGVASLTLGIMLTIIGLVIRLLSRNPLKDHTTDT